MFFDRQFKRLPRPDESLIYREPKYLAYTFRSGRGASILLKNGASVVQIRQYLRYASAATTLAH
jgi:hypothetical protein